MTNKDSFRKAALDRLASPEQVDKILHVTGSKEWVAVIAVVLMMVTAAVWAFEGSIPTKAQGQGVLVRPGGLRNVFSLRGGLVLSLDVAVGQKVKAHQVVARVAQPALVEKVRATRVELEQARREGAWSVQMAERRAALDSEALETQRTNTLREIEGLEQQTRLAADQIPVQERLLAKGLVTRQQTISARLRLTALQQQIASRHALIKQFEAQRYASESQPKQADTERRAQIRHLELVLDGQEKELALSQNVIAQYSGEVTELKAAAGAVIPAESSIMAIQPETDKLEVLVCIPSNVAKSVAVGMNAEVSPSTARREEFGFMRGKVVAVADYPATPSSLMRSFQSEALVNALSEAGPVHQIRIDLIPDPSAVSGFQWSSSKGPPITISSGTLSTVEIITRQQKPIAMLLPAMKRTLGLN